MAHLQRAVAHLWIESCRLLRLLQQRWRHMQQEDSTAIGGRVITTIISRECLSSARQRQPMLMS